MMYHNPVLLEESVSALAIVPDGIYVDVTFGGGGHSRRILESLSSQGRLIAFDQDKDSAANVPDDPRITFVPSNFKHLKRFLQYHQAYPVNGILADLGVSSHQFDTPERGFSHRFDGQLDMRMNTAAGISAADVVNRYPEQRLSEIFFLYGELHDARRLARLIVKKREEGPIDTTQQLRDTLQDCLPKGRENKVLSQIFQAIRIEVNSEYEVLREFLAQTPEALLPGGRLVVISYHSLEDKLVKNFIRSGNLEGKIEKDFYGNQLTPFKVITRKAIVPTEEEIEINSRARSAKLRVAEKLKTKN